MNRRLGLALLSAVLLLSGCATAPRVTDPVTARQQQRLLAINEWHINGKIGYKDADTGGSAWIDWRQQGQDFSLDLRGPFGAGSTRIEVSRTGATLLQSGKEPLYASSASLLTDYLFGWPWPVEDLPYWVKGVPSPQTPVDSVHYDANRLLTELRQSGWQLQFSHYLNAFEGLPVPGKITGRFEDVSFTLVIKSWLPTVDEQH